MHKAQNTARNSVFTGVMAEWQSWIIQNVKLGCDESAMVDLLVQRGHLTTQAAKDAIDEARTIINGVSAIPPVRPLIDLLVNTIRLPDKSVDVLMTMHTPEIFLFANVLSSEECDSLMAYANERLIPSTVITDHDDGQQLHAARTSHGVMMVRGQTPLVATIESRLAALVNWPVQNGEGMQVLKYGVGNEYRPHFDWFDPTLPGPRKHLERGGQRVGTIILYLSDVEAGGSTTFPNIGCQIKPQQGSAVYFANTNPLGVPNQNAYHGGDPVITGTKFIATKWLRACAHI